MRSSPDQSRFVVLSFDRDAIPYIWNLTSLRSELGELGLDWPAEILKERQRAESDLADEKPLVISFDASSLSGASAGAKLTP